MISIILPIHNQAPILMTNVFLVKNFFDKSYPDYELLLAEDGSTDTSYEIAKTIAGGKIRLLSSKKRLGRGLALKKAIRESKGDIVIYMDTDLATDLSFVEPLIKQIESGIDISTGSRLIKGSVVVGRGFVRDFFSKSYNLFIRILFSSKIHDHQCGFKAFKRKNIVKIMDSVEDISWFWDTEILLRGQANGLKVSEIPVKWTDQKRSKVNIFSDIFKMGCALIALRLKIHKLI